MGTKDSKILEIMRNASGSGCGSSLRQFVAQHSRIRFVQTKIRLFKIDASVAMVVDMVVAMSVATEDTSLVLIRRGTQFIKQIYFKQISV